MSKIKEISRNSDFKPSFAEKPKWKCGFKLFHDEGP